MLDFPRQQQAWAPDSHQPLPVQSWSQEGGQALVIIGHTQESGSQLLPQHAPGLQTWGVKVRPLPVSLSPKTCPPGHPAWAEPWSKGLTRHRPAALRAPLASLGALATGPALCS